MSTKKLILSCIFILILIAICSTCSFSVYYFSKNSNKSENTPLTPTPTPTQVSTATPTLSPTSKITLTITPTPSVLTTTPTYITTTPIENSGSIEGAYTKDISTNYYNVIGNTETEIRDYMNKNGYLDPNENEMYDAVTLWKNNYTFNYDQKDNKCYLTEFNLTSDIEINLPKWTPQSNSSEELKNKWDTYMTNLVLHENGHRDLVLKNMQGFYDKFNDSYSASTCLDLEDKIKEEFNMAANNLKEESIKYDADTDHGATQGAVFP